ncbi:cell death activator CIDE-3 isoform X2 [Conger conger]|uniref:cell death activator CIDE-3 isoform X2 n=1 Tax=Conger conger TaxID=82655 RepID=UPI002A5AC34F|nr:cell death activator CIDE-3 isoform X2 [Conger conger]
MVRRQDTAEGSDCLFSEKMEYAKRSLSLLSPTSLSKCVTASVTASASMTQQLLTGLTPRLRAFRVTNADRSVRKGIVADGLRDLIDKVTDAMQVSCVRALVLDEDGTEVDTEQFFQTLQDTVFMVLEKGQKWTPSPNSPRYEHFTEHRPPRRKDVARLTFDLYKNNPQDFIGCLNVKATLYGMYSISYDLHCYGAKRMLKEVLRWTLFTMQATGHVLLGSSCYMQQLLDEEEKGQEMLSNMPENMDKQMQSLQWGKTGV